MRPRRGERRSAWRERREIPREDGRRAGKRRARRLRIAGGDGGIRTLDRALQPYNGLANRRLQPLGHVSRRNARRDICPTHPPIASAWRRAWRGLDRELTARAASQKPAANR